jgi:hypothetical protein
MAMLTAAIDASGAVRGAQQFRDAKGRMVSGARQINKSLTGVNTRMKTVGATASRVRGMIAGMFGGYAAYRMFRSMIDAVSEQEATLAQLRAGLASTGSVSGQTIRSLTKLSAEMQRLTNYSNETVESAQAIMLSFTHISGDVFPRAMKVTADIATRMGTDLKGSVIQVAKALNDPVANLSALSRAGIQFSKDQKEVINALVETNRLGEAQTLILKEMENQYGGSAKAAKDTMGGAVAALRNEWDDLIKSIGMSEKGVLKDVTETLAAMLRLLNGNATEADKLDVNAQRLLITLKGIAGVVGLLVTIKLARWTYANATAFVAWTRSGIASATMLAGVAKGVGLVGTALASYSIGETLYREVGWINRLMKDIATGLLGMEAYAVYAARAASGDKDAAAKLTADIKNIMDGYNTTHDDLDKLGGKGLVGGVQNNLIKNINASLSAALPKWAAYGKAGSKAARDIEEALDKLNKSPYIIAEGYSIGPGGLATARRGPQMGKHTPLPEGYEMPGGLATLRKVKADEADEPEVVASRWTKACEDVRQTWEQVGRTIGDSVGGALESILFDMDEFTSAADVARSLFQDIARQIFRASVGSFISSAFTFNPVASANGNVFSHGNLIPFANGGIVQRPTMFQMAGGRRGIMAEAEPEAIMPLARGRDGKLGVKGGGTVVNQHFVIHAKDADSFRRSKGQIAADLRRAALQRG